MVSRTGLGEADDADNAGGPLLFGAIATATTLTPALLMLAARLSATAAIVAAPATRRGGHPTGGSPSSRANQRKPYGDITFHEQSRRPQAETGLTELGWGRPSACHVTKGQPSR